MPPPGNVERALRPACRLAVAVAIEGEQADPPVPAPAALRPVLGFSRLSAAAYAAIRRVVDDNGTFRARVAERAEEAEVGRAGWLWLHRPVDWADDPVFAGEAAGSAGSAAAPPADERGRSAEPGATRDRTAKLRRQVAELEAERRRLVAEVADQRRAHDRAEAAHRDLEARLSELQEERNAVVRASKAVEADLAATRRDLKAARAATRQAEAELAELRREVGPEAAVVGSTTTPSGGDGREAAPAEPAAPGSPAGMPMDAVATSVSAAAGAAAELARALAEVAELVAPAELEPSGAGPSPSPPTPRRGSGDGGGGRRRRTARRAPTLPPGVFDDTDDALRHLVGSASNLVVVDGYNLARAAWSGLPPEEERRRTVALLEEVQARSGGPVVVVFDGDGSVVAPHVSKHVRVRFSAAGQTADDLIAELVAAVPPEQPVVVISADRAVMADARRQGAVAVGSADLLRATGR